MATLPPVFTNVPSRSDNENFPERADEAWANLQVWLLFLTDVYNALQAGLAAPIGALQLSSSLRIVGRLSAGAGASEELTDAQVAALLQGSGLVANLAGFRGLPQNSRSADYAVQASDVGRHIYHPAADTTARTWTLPANSGTPIEPGGAVTFINDGGDITIAIADDTLVMAGTGGTGSRTLSSPGVATAVKVGATRWMISGTGLS